MGQTWYDHYTAYCKFIHPGLSPSMITGYSSGSPRSNLPWLRLRNPIPVSSEFRADRIQPSCLHSVFVSLPPSRSFSPSLTLPSALPSSLPPLLQKFSLSLSFSLLLSLSFFSNLSSSLEGWNTVFGKLNT